MNTITILSISGLTALIAVYLIRELAIRYQIGALPSARKIHEGFIPLLGGLGIFVGLITGIFVACLLGFFPMDVWINHGHFWIGLLIILLVGFVDDVRGVTHIQKFGGQFLAAGIAVYGGCMIQAFFSPTTDALNLGWLAFPFSLMWIVFIINAVNLLDGLDGLAGGVSLIMTTGFLLLAIISKQPYWIVFCAALIGGLLGFLKYNYRPASIFMGDVGSLMLGYTLACLSIETLKVAGSNQVYFLAALALLGMPVTDTLISFFRRMGRGDHPFKPDREHIHHRLLKLGLTHLDSVWLMYYFTLLFVVLGVLMVVYREFAGILLFILAFIFAIFWAWRLGYLETRKMLSFGTSEQETEAGIRAPIHVENLWHKIALLLGDIFSINMAMYLTWWFKFQSGIINPLTIKSLQDYFAVPVWLVFSGGWLILFWLNGLYRMHWDVSRYEQFWRVTKIITFGILALLFFVNIDILVNPSNLTIFNTNQITTQLFYWTVMVGGVNFIRLLIIKWEKRYHIFEYTYKNTIIVGATRRGKNVIRDIKSNPHLLHQIIGIVTQKSQAAEFEGYPVLGNYKDLPDLIHRHKIEEIIIAANDSAREDLLNVIGICDRLQVVIKTLPGLQSIVSGRSPELAAYSLVRAFPENMVLWQWTTKRLIDIVFSFVCIFVALPIWMLLSIFIKMRFRKSPFVKIPIMGKNGRIFNMYLFRLSRGNAVTDLVYQSSALPKKLSKFGNALYKTNFYKLPQLFNILRGDMSLVGPRPEPVEWYRQHQNQYRFLHRRVMVRPGITGVAQLKYRFEASQKMLRERLKLDIFYSENISLKMDLRIILRSIVLLLRQIFGLFSLFSRQNTG